jgi:hypothetical protein
VAPYCFKRWNGGLIASLAQTSASISLPTTNTTTMPWPTLVARQFEKVPSNPSEADFHGPYNRLLYTLFPADTLFTVVPQYMPKNARESTDYIVMFEVLLEDKPVFILGLKPPQHLRWASTREAADVQIRSRIRDIACSLRLL